MWFSIITRCADTFQFQFMWSCSGKSPLANITGSLVSVSFLGTYTHSYSSPNLSRRRSWRISITAFGSLALMSLVSAVMVRTSIVSGAAVSSVPAANSGPATSTNAPANINKLILFTYVPPVVK